MTRFPCLLPSRIFFFPLFTFAVRSEPIYSRGEGREGGGVWIFWRATRTGRWGWDWIRDGGEMERGMEWMDEREGRNKKWEGTGGFLKCFVQLCSLSILYFFF